MRLRAFLLAACAGLAAAPAAASDLWDRFQNPPADARPMVRWWWFGPAVTDAEIDREIRAMKAGGFGGFEVQPTYPLTNDDPPAGHANIPFLSDEFIRRLAHAGATARAEKMRIDVTIGTGWPFGGPHVPITEAAALVRKVELPVPPGKDSLRLPPLAAGETWLAAYAGDARIPMVDGSVTVPRGGVRVVSAFVAGRTGQQVKRAAVGGEGFVIDHVDGQAVAHHLRAVGDRLLEAFPRSAPPYAMFSDSLEAYGSSWTGDLPAEFRKRRGYDLLDHLPALIDDKPESAAVRHDWARTLSELVDDRYLSPVDSWAKARGTRFRAQVYGFPPPSLSSNALVALPEGEGASWRRFTSTRWATSAAHLYGKAVVSSETWTWLHSPSWAATPLDMKVEADRHFLQGVNQLIGHGWPYSPSGVPEPGWAFYAASALNDHNPWYPAMPAITRYLTRTSAMLREGTPANEIAIYLPTEDTLADLKPANASVNEEMVHRLPETLIGSVLDAGYGFDFVDAQAVIAGKLGAKVLILPMLQRIDAKAYAAIARWAANGGRVIAINRAPNLSGGLLDGASATRAVQATGKGLFGGGRARIVPQPGIVAALRAAATPAVSWARADSRLGFVHRRIAGGDLYFVANTGNAPVDTKARFAGDNGRGAWWDAQTGARQASGTGEIAIRLAPYESRILVFSDEAPPANGGAAATRTLTDLSKGWTVTLEGKPARAPNDIGPWTTGGADSDFSGRAIYRKTLTLGAIPAGRLFLDFGEGTPIASPAGGRDDRPRAMLAAPVREAALVTIDGKAAGTLWAPPYRLDVTGLLKAGENRIEVTVMNTALNALAARGPIDPSLLTQRYGERFTNQDQQLITPQPSGLTGPVRLIVE